MYPGKGTINAPDPICQGQSGLSVFTDRRPLQPGSEVLCRRLSKCGPAAHPSGKQASLGACCRSCNPALLVSSGSGLLLLQ